ncbi:MAG: methyltransferase domain-containing protein [Bacteroidia bacterium]|nr:methyltransferase domain-containing protein [Bacteroidia bacterium]
MSSETTQWYASWFNTPYYHILYRDRDHVEAHEFMDRLTRHLKLNKDAHILDLACGRGRHSIYLNKIGYEVTGLDLSEESIQYARQFENDRLHFDMHDMCMPYKKQFDAVFNLFTSFGYFEHDADNLKTIKAIQSDLKPEGLAVIDFMNVPFVAKNLIAENVKSVDGITFKLNRRIEDGHIIKEIKFADGDEDFFFTYSVKALRLHDFQAMFNEANLKLVEICGDYHLNPFVESTSERLIMIFKRL